MSNPNWASNAPWMLTAPQVDLSLKLSRLRSPERRIERLRAAGAQLVLEKQRATRRHWQFVPRDSACEGHLEQLGVADDQVRNSFDAWFSPGTTRVVVKDSITDPAAKLLEERGR